MKKLIIIVLCAFVGFANAQNVKEAKENLGTLEDQFKNKFNTKDLNGDFVIISIPVTDQPFKVYDLLKGVKLKPGVFVVGGFNRPGGHGQGMPSNHLSDGFSNRYGKDYLSIWIDRESAVSKALNTKGHAVIRISKNKIVKSTDYGNKLDDFMKEIEELKQK